MVVHPEYQRLKLWDDVLDGAIEPETELRRIAPHASKFVLPIDQQSPESVPLAGIFFLNQGSSLSFDPIRGCEKLDVLWKHLACRFASFDRQFGALHFPLLSQLNRTIELVQITRPDDRRFIPILANAVERRVERSRHHAPAANAAKQTQERN